MLPFFSVFIEKLSFMTHYYYAVVLEIYFSFNKYQFFSRIPKYKFISKILLL